MPTTIWTVASSDSVNCPLTYTLTLTGNYNYDQYGLIDSAVPEAGFSTHTDITVIFADFDVSLVPPAYDLIFKIQIWGQDLSDSLNPGTKTLQGSRDVVIRYDNTCALTIFDTYTEPVLTISHTAGDVTNQIVTLKPYISDSLSKTNSPYNGYKFCSGARQIKIDDLANSNEYFDELSVKGKS